MENTGKLAELLEKAACSVNMLGPADLGEIDGLDRLVNEIRQSLEAISSGPAELVEQAKHASENAHECLQEILQQAAADTAASLETVSQTICSLQQLCNRILALEETDAPPADGVTDTSQAPVETSGEASTDGTLTAEASQGGTVIPEDDVPLVMDFIAESQEHLETAEAGLLELENNPGDQETLNRIFRAFHTIKGTAGFLNLSDISSLAHSAENLLDMARKGELVMAGQNTDAILESMDLLKKMIGVLRECAEASRPVPTQEKLPRLLTKLEALAKDQELARMLATPSGAADDRKLDDMLQEPSQTSGEGAASLKSQAADDKIKVSTARLDELINMTGELVIAHSMVAEDIRKGASPDACWRNVTHQGKIVRELQELSMSMRMVPISGVFQKMARLVRDLSRKAGKKVDFRMSGEETELDRTIVDKIADPLVHMVRNSVDHGLETADERRQAGKDVTGRVELRAFHQAGSIVIEIEDDGRGLDKDRILKKAVEKGIVPAGQTLSDDEIYRLIFHAGLSTARTITSVSGRGVGMDVVKRNIEALRGRIDIVTAVGKGTTFSIRLPLTLAIIDGQIVSVGDQRYILPINAIEQSLRPTKEQVSTVMNRGEMAMVRGELLPVVRLHDVFKTGGARRDWTESLLVVVEENGRKCCLMVDELLGQQQVVIKSLGQAMGSIEGVSGGAIMGDGRVSLILDVPGLMELAMN
ncbi:MAG TPA: chemotaxis protein CheA [Anaerohalosphaeraceae bacterium]|nr:chemotaxis protein CheA [Anaerohalosphaeraceae bacterium]HRT50095.1 chemotaxis protein CheA [Anaerohalosphaeraceae bacterium]HRT86029.1 chemotaxis protein CheA [Anaerohalosphaeraceae bacterium]